MACLRIIQVDAATLMVVEENPHFHVKLFEYPENNEYKFNELLIIIAITCASVNAPKQVYFFKAQVFVKTHFELYFIKLFEIIARCFKSVLISAFISVLRNKCLVQRPTLALDHLTTCVTYFLYFTQVFKLRMKTISVCKSFHYLMELTYSVYVTLFYFKYYFKINS